MCCVTEWKVLINMQHMQCLLRMTASPPMALYVADSPCFTYKQQIAGWEPGNKDKGETDCYYLHYQSAWLHCFYTYTHTVHVPRPGQILCPRIFHQEWSPILIHNNSMSSANLQHQSYHYHSMMVVRYINHMKQLRCMYIHSISAISPM